MVEWIFKILMTIVMFGLVLAAVFLVLGLLANIGPIGFLIAIGLGIAILKSYMDSKT